MAKNWITEKWGPWYIGQIAFIEKGYLKVLSFKGLKTYIALCRHADTETGRAWPTIKVLVDETGLSKNSLYKAVKKLEGLGLIKTWRSRKDKSQVWGKKFYQILRIEDICPPARYIYPGTAKTDLYTPKRDEKGRFRAATYRSAVQVLYRRDGPIKSTAEMDVEQDKDHIEQEQISSSIKDSDSEKEGIRELIKAIGKEKAKETFRKIGFNPSLIDEVAL